MPYSAVLLLCMQHNSDGGVPVQVISERAAPESERKQPQASQLYRREPAPHCAD